MRKQGVLVSDLAEEVGPICAREQCGRDQVYGHVAPALLAHKNPIFSFASDLGRTRWRWLYLVSGSRLVDRGVQRRLS